MRRWTPVGLAASIVALGLGLRIAFVAWAPRELSGDALHYHLHAVSIADGRGYVELDGSPSVRWMPGWPFALSALYRALGDEPLAGMLLNALSGAAVVAALIRIGTLWFGVSCGLWAGLLYAVWPGVVYYCATLMTEPFFSALLVACLLALNEAARDASRRWLAWSALAGFALGSAAIVKAETWALLPVIAVFCACALPAGRRCWAACAFALAACVWVVPWTARNYAQFERFVPTTATSGANAWLGTHPGARGGQSIVEMRGFISQHRRESTAETLFAASEAGWREVRRFALADPLAVLEIAGRKLALTYGSDGQGARLIRGVGVGRIGYIPEARRRALERFANLWWAAMALAVLVGLAGVGRWPASARIVCLGLPACWLAVHLVFLGGPRFHVPETPVYALIAASAIGRATGKAPAASGADREE